MTINEMIEVLTKLRNEVGNVKVFVNAPMANIDCWIHDDMIEVKKLDDKMIEKF